MDLISILATVILTTTIGTVVVGVAAYGAFKLRDKRKPKKKTSADGKAREEDSAPVFLTRFEWPVEHAVVQSADKTADKAREPSAEESINSPAPANTEPVSVQESESSASSDGLPDGSLLNQDVAVQSEAGLTSEETITVEAATGSHESGAAAALAVHRALPELKLEHIHPGHEAGRARSQA